MAKIKNIPKAYFHLLLIFLGLKKHPKYAKDRLKICFKCNKGKLKCPQCGCPSIAMTLVEEEKCDLNKW